MREFGKGLARALSLVVVSPLLVTYAIRRVFVGPDRALESSTQLLALLPGLSGSYLRRAFLSQTLARCAPTATIEFGTIFSQTGAIIDDRAYVGPRCHLGLVHLEPDVLVAAGVHIPSGGDTHASDDLTRPIREQGGTRTLVRIGEGTWIGSAAVVLANVGRHSIIGAGAVVTRVVPDFVVAAGVPAVVLKSRSNGPNDPS